MIWLSLSAIVSKVFVQAECCGSWFDCAECHDEVHNHQFVTGRILRLMCKDCSRVFQRDLGMFLESDKFCEQCKVKWCIPGKEGIWFSVIFYLRFVDHGRDYSREYYLSWKQGTHEGSARKYPHGGWGEIKRESNWSGIRSKGTNEVGGEQRGW